MYNSLYECVVDSKTFEKTKQLNFHTVFEMFASFMYTGTSYLNFRINTKLSIFSNVPLRHCELKQGYMAYLAG